MRDLYNKGKLTTYEYMAFTTMCVNLKNSYYKYNIEKEIFEDYENNRT